MLTMFIFMLVATGLFVAYAEYQFRIGVPERTKEYLKYARTMNKKNKANRAK